MSQCHTVELFVEFGDSLWFGDILRLTITFQTIDWHKIQQKIQQFVIETL